MATGADTTGKVTKYLGTYKCKINIFSKICVLADMEYSCLQPWVSYPMSFWLKEITFCLDSKLVISMIFSSICSLESCLKARLSLMGRLLFFILSIPYSWSVDSNGFLAFSTFIDNAGYLAKCFVNIFLSVGWELEKKPSNLEN